MCEVFICKNRPQLSSGREDCIRLYWKQKPSPISASNWSLFNTNGGIRPRTVKRVAAFLDLGVFPPAFYDTIQLHGLSMRALWLSLLFPGCLSKQYSTDTSHSRSIYAGPKKINRPAILSSICRIRYHHPPKIQQSQS